MGGIKDKQYIYLYIYIILYYVIYQVGGKIHLNHQKKKKEEIEDGSFK